MGAVGFDELLLDLFVEGRVDKVRFIAPVPCDEIGSGIGQGSVLPRGDAAGKGAAQGRGFGHLGDLDLFARDIRQDLAPERSFGGAPGEDKAVAFHPGKGGDFFQVEGADDGGVLFQAPEDRCLGGEGGIEAEIQKRGGGTLEMAQLWVNLPARDKLGEPAYQAVGAAQIPEVVLPENAGSLRVIAGEYAGAQGPARTHSPMNVWDLRLNASSHAAFTLSEGWTTLLVVLRGEVTVDGKLIQTAQTGHFSRGGTELAVTVGQDSQVLLLSGAPLNEPIAHYGPFVMNTKQELITAIEDFNSGRFGRLMDQSAPMP